MSPVVKTYEIKGRGYELLQPVLGVLMDIANIGSNIMVSTVEGVHVSDVLQALGDKRGIFLAAMLTPKGVHPKDRDLEAMAEEMTWGCRGKLAGEITDDFFAQGDVVSELAGMSKAGLGLLRAVVPPSPGANSRNTQSEPSSSSLEETSSNETPSSGDIGGTKSNRSSMSESET